MKFEQSETTQRLVRYLQAHEKGASIGYAELANIAAAPVDARNSIGARRALERDHNQVWICVKPKIGLVRLNDMEIAERLPRWWMRGAKSKLRRGGKQSEVVETESLDVAERTRFAVDCIQRELAFESLSKATRSKMERVARGTSNDLPAFTAVEWAISLTKREKRA